MTRKINFEKIESYHIKYEDEHKKCDMGSNNDNYLKYIGMDFAYIIFYPWKISKNDPYFLPEQISIRKGFNLSHLKKV